MTGQSQRKAEQRPSALFRFLCSATQESPHDPPVVRHRSHRRLHSTVLSGNQNVTSNNIEAGRPPSIQLDPISPAQRGRYTQHTQKRNKESSNVQ
jgi:hypothetical protein